MRMNADDLAMIDRIYKAKIDDRDRRMVPIWEEIAPLTNPQMADWADENPTQADLATGRTIYDSSGIEASNTLASGVVGWAFGRNVAWFKFTPEDSALLQDRALMLFLEEAERIRYNQFSRSNFYDEGRSFIKCCADFGTAVMIRESDQDKRLQTYTTLHPKRYAMVEDRYGRVDALFYDFWIDAIEAAARFGEENLPDAIRTQFENKTTTLYKFTTAIFPADKWELKSDTRRIAKGKPYLTYTVADCDRTKTVQEDGYTRKPFFAWRWAPSLDGTEWGVDAPGLNSLGYMKQANAMRKEFSRMVALAASPPIKATEQLQGRIQVVPRGVTYLKPGEDFGPVAVAGNLQSLQVDLQDLGASIRKMYQTDVFLILSQNMDRQKTATEVAGLQGEKAALMSAFYGRLAAEFLEPILEDGFQDDLDMGLLIAPPEYAGAQLKIDMVSPLAQLQKQALTVDSSRRFIQEMATLAQFNPEVMDAANLDEYLAALGESYNVPKKIVRDLYEIGKIRSARAQLQAQAQAAQLQQMQTQTQATAMEAAGKAPEPGSPMAQMVGAR